MTGPGDDAIGGYLSLDMAPGSGLPWLDCAHGFQSARSAITAILLSLRPRSAWVPYFACGAVADAVTAAGTTLKRYPIDRGHGVPDDLELAPDEVLVCIDYFGLGQRTTDAAISRYGADRVIVDASQSLYYRAAPDVTAVYSPRKFVGLPDGGLARTALSLSDIAAADEAGSAARCAHLLSRTAGRVEEGYAQFLQAEESLEDCAPRAMSRLTRRLLDGIDFTQVARRRRENYTALMQLLRERGHAVADLPDDAVPLCCPLTGVDAAAMRPGLAARRIYTPAYWPDADIPASDPVGIELRNHTVYLPCDQRYCDEQIHRVAESVFQLGQNR